MVTLYTPATGFPDLEAKIAYGLARVGIEAGGEVWINPAGGIYEVTIRFNNSEDESHLNRAFYLLLERILSSQQFYELGVKAKDRAKYPTVEKETKNFKERLHRVDLLSLYQNINREDFVFTKEKSCHHKEFSKFGTTTENKKQLGGLILLASIHAGKPQYRDKRSKDLNLGLCEICGYLNVLGKESFTFTIQLGKGRNRKFVWVTPIPQRRMNNSEIIYLLSMQKTLHNFWLSDLLPLRTFTLSLLAKVPSISDVVKELDLNFHLSLISKDNRGDTVIEQSELVNGVPFSKFISTSPYNSATIERLLKGTPKISTLLEITHIIEKLDKFILPRFPRLYSQETSTNNFVNLLYPETSKYLLKEVAMIRQNIIENQAIGSLARTLRYFVREHKYHYADNIRNARQESKTFEETIAKMLREGRLRREQNKEIHLPTEDEMKEVFRLANEWFEDVKITLILLAFSFPSKAEEGHAGEAKTLEEVQNA